MSIDGQAVSTFGNVNIKSIEIEAKVIRADGTVEELGRIAGWHRSPIIRTIWRLKRWLHS